MLRIPGMVHRQVGGDPVQPGRELRFCPITFTRTVNAQEHFLSQFFGDSLAAHHAKQKMHHGPVVLLHQVTEARFIARRHAKHDGGIACRVSGREVPVNYLTFCVRVGPRCRALSQCRIVQDERCHIFWNTIVCGRLRFWGTFRIGIFDRRAR